jgi:hypothetical protein
MEQMNSNMSYLSEKLSPSIEYQKLIQYNKNELIVLLRQITDIQYEKFQKTEIYPRIFHLKCFTYAEQEMLEKEIKYHFEILINSLHSVCPQLTSKELLICCLSLWFPALMVSSCFGYSNNNNLKQHKSRIKKKMTMDSDNAFLFNFIFKK